MSIFSAIGKWFKGTTQEVIDVVDPVEESVCACGGQCTCGDSSQVEMSACACGGQCTCGDSSQQETVSFATVTGEDSRAIQDVLKDTQEEIAAVADVVIEEAEKVAEVVEEQKTLSAETIAAADKVAADLIEEVTTRVESSAVVTDTKPKATRKRKPSRKARKKK